MRVELPGGHHAELREKVTVGGRELMRECGVDVFAELTRLFPEVNFSDQKQAAELDLADQDVVRRLDRKATHAFTEFNKATVVALLRMWSLPEALPRTLEAVDELDPEIYDALLVATAPYAIKALTGRQFLPSDNPVAALRDAETPTVLSSDSNGGELAPTTPWTSPPTGF